MSRQFYGADPSLNGSRLPTAAQPPPIMPMQDRVREIRAMPSPSAIDMRKVSVGTASPYNSRSPSLAPEAPLTKPVFDSRPEAQQTDVVQPDQMVHRTDQILIDQVITPQEFEDIEELKSLGLGPMEFAISLSMPTRVRDQYNSTVQFFNKHVKSFLSGNHDQSTIDSMRRLINRLNNVSTHVDLEDDTTQSQREHEVPAEDEANWAVSSSGKFQFLKHLFLQLQDTEKHIAVVAKPNRLLEILERFIIGLNFNYYREDNGNSYNEGIRSLRITLVASTTTQAPPQGRHANLVIAFDSSFESDNLNIQSLRTVPNNPFYLAPVVRPLVYCSAEHIQKCVLDGLPILDNDLDRLKATIACVSRNRSEVGVLQDTESKPDAAAEEVGAFVMEGGRKFHWSLPDVLPIKLNGLEIVAANHDPLHDRPFDQQETSNAPDSPTSRKRQSEDVAMAETPKRSRMSPNHDIGNANDPLVISQTSQITELTSRVAELQQALERAEIGAQTNASRILTQDTDLLEKEKELEEYRNAVTDVQTRFENRTRAYKNIKRGKELLEQELAKAKERMQMMNASNEELRNGNRNLEEELKLARERLANSNIPEAAELEAAQAQSRTLASENESLKRQIASKTMEADFAREEYQTASSRASELASRTKQMEAELADQKRLTSAARLQQDNFKTAEKLHQQNVERARLEADELREQLRRRERGRGMTTRTTSVAPRSPRLGASPVRSRAGSRAPGSRASSPPRGLFGSSGRRPRGMVEQTL